MTEINGVVRGIQHHFVHSHYVAFAEGDDFQLPSAGAFDDFLQCQRGAGRGILFLSMMALEDLPEVFMTQRGGSTSHRVKKKIYSNGKIPGIEKTNPT